MPLPRLARSALAASAALVTATTSLACTHESASAAPPLADLPPVLAGATRVVADGRGADPTVRLDGAEGREPVIGLRDYISFLAATDMTDRQGAYYLFPIQNGADPHPNRIVVVTAERGPTPASDVFAKLSDRIEKVQEGVPLDPGEQHILEPGNGGRITCDHLPAKPAPDSRTPPRRAYASCTWADRDHLVRVNSSDTDIPAVRAMIDTIRTAVPTTTPR
ncbi:hypothetical protein [Embleya sp. NPDC059259]|uniref:hypothetical protein n=1 Tax=unclassified Embleya TaxID=2699296 RepID=UPI00368E8CA9